MKVTGYCPMGCGETLWLTASTMLIECQNPGCPDPIAASKVLDDAETEHIAVFDEEHFHLQHPLRERIDAELFDCEVHRRLGSVAGPPPEGPGRYRVTVHQPDAYSESYRSGDAGLDFEKLA